MRIPEAGPGSGTGMTCRPPPTDLNCHFGATCKSMFTTEQCRISVYQKKFWMRHCMGSYKNKKIYAFLIVCSLAFSLYHAKATGNGDAKMGLSQLFCTQPVCFVLFRGFIKNATKRIIWYCTLFQKECLPMSADRFVAIYRYWYLVSILRCS